MSWGLDVFFRSLMFAILFAATPTLASTYYLQFEIDSSSYSYRNYEGISLGYEDGPMLVSGYVETDGALGLVSASDFLSWEFTFETDSHSRTMSSSLGDLYATARGIFEVTQQTVTATDDFFRFFMYDYGPNPDGNQREFFWYLEGDANNLSARTRFFTYPFENETEYLIGNAETSTPLTFHRGPPATVPVSPSMAFLIAGLGILGFVRFRLRNG